MFMYLDKHYVSESGNLLTTHEKGYHLFRYYVFEHFKDIAIINILKCINDERDGKQENTYLIGKSIQVTYFYNIYIYMYALHEYIVAGLKYFALYY